MLSEEHLTQLTTLMVLTDILNKHRKDGLDNEELSQLSGECREYIGNVMKTLDEEEINQAMERYAEERNSGEYKTLPPI